MYVKKIMACLLVLLVSAPLFFSVGFILKQKSIETDMKQRLKTVLLQTVTVPAKEVKWIKVNKEILINGHFFDVKTALASGNNVIFTGLYDEDEHQLHKKLGDFLENKKKHSAPLHELIAKFFMAAVAVPVNELSHTIVWKNIAGEFYHKAEKIPISYNAPVYQPPRI